jgi:hypothetical protein
MEVHMSERKGLQVVAGLLLAVAGIFACYLASQAVELYQLISSWTVKENYVHDTFNVCKLFLWALGAHWCYQSFRSGLNLFAHDPRDKNRQPQQQNGNKPQQNPSHNQGNQNQNRLPQQLPIK